MSAPSARRWPLQDAKNRFSEVVNAAQEQGPQIVTRRGADTAVVLSYADYQKLGRPPSRGVVELLLSAPKIPGGLSVERNRDTARDMGLG